MATPSTEQRELQLIENVEFKILGVANKEEKLHQLLQRYLAPVILKAASDHVSVRARASGTHHARTPKDPTAEQETDYSNPGTAQDVHSAPSVRTPCSPLQRDFRDHRG